MKRTAPTPERVDALIDHFYTFGAYSQCAEVNRLGQERDHFKAAMKAAVAHLEQGQAALALAVLQKALADSAEGYDME